MRKILLGINLLIQSYVSAEETAQKLVLELHDNNIQSEIENHGNIFLAFYDPADDLSKSLIPEMELAAQEIQQQGWPVKLAKIDVMENPEVFEHYNIEGLPMIYFYTNNIAIEYYGTQEKDNIVNWIGQKQKSVLQLTCPQIQEQIQNKSNNFVLAFFGETSHPLYKSVFLNASLQDEELLYVQTADPECPLEFGQPKAEQQMVFFRRFDEPIIPVVNTIKTVLDLGVFLRDFVEPDVQIFTDTSFEDIFEHLKNTLILFRPQSDANATYIKTYREAARKLKREFVFAISDADEELQKSFAQYMGINSSELPILMALMPENEKKYKCNIKPADLTVDKIVEFTHGLENGEIEPYYKSQEPLPKNGSMHHLVGKNFAQIVHDENKDVFVKFYAPWCTDSQALAPIWDRLAEEFSNNTHIIFAKIDATQNDVEDLQLEDFPTLILYTKDFKDGFHYEGKENYESIKEWLTEMIEHEDHEEVVKIKGKKTVEKHEDL